MVPYFHHPVLLDFGTVKVYTFGTLVGIAIIAGLYLLTHRAKATGLNERTAEHLHYVSVGFGLFLGHIFNTFMYEPGRLETEGWIVLLKPWDGMSSLGGIMGGLLAASIYLRYKKANPAKYLDAFFYAFTFAWVIARLGCTLVHDHPGSPTDFFLGVQYPGGTRHDLGFYEFLTFVPLAAYMWFTRFRPRFAGWYVLTWGLVMGPLRFFGDFLREGDLRWFVSDDFRGITPAQMFIPPLFLLAIVFYVRWSRTGEIVTPKRKV